MFLKTRNKTNNIDVFQGCGSGFQISLEPDPVFKFFLDPDPVSAQILEQKKSAESSLKMISEEKLKIMTKYSQKIKKTTITF